MPVSFKICLKTPQTKKTIFRVKPEDKVLLVQLECLALRVLMDPEVHLAAGDLQETLECLDLRE